MTLPSPRHRRRCLATAIVTAAPVALTATVCLAQAPPARVTLLPSEKPGERPAQPPVATVGTDLRSAPETVGNGIVFDAQRQTFYATPQQRYGRAAQLFIIRPNTFRYSYDATFAERDFHTGGAPGALADLLASYTVSESALNATELLTALRPTNEAGRNTAKVVGPPPVIRDAFQRYVAAYERFRRVTGGTDALAAPRAVRLKALVPLNPGKGIEEAIRYGSDNVGTRYRAAIAVCDYFRKANEPKFPDSPPGAPTPTEVLLTLTDRYTPVAGDKITEEVLRVRAGAASDPRETPASVVDMNEPTRRQLASMSELISGAASDAIKELDEARSDLRAAEDAYRTAAETYYNLYQLGGYLQLDIKPNTTGVVPDAIFSSSELTNAASQAANAEAGTLAQQQDAKVNNAFDEFLRATTLDARQLAREELQKIENNNRTANLPPAVAREPTPAEVKAQEASLAIRQGNAAAALSQALLEQAGKQEGQKTDEFRKARRLLEANLLAQIILSPDFGVAYKRAFEAEKQKRARAADKNPISIVDLREIAREVTGDQYDATKALDERIKVLNTLADAAYEKRTQRLQEVKGNLDSTVKLFAATLDTTLYPAYKREQTDPLKGDELDVKIKINTAQPPTLAQKSAKKEGAAADAGGEGAAAATTATVDIQDAPRIPVVGRWVLDASAGPLVSGLVKREYYLENSSFGKVPRARARDKTAFATGALLHYYLTHGSQISFGPALGVTTTGGKDPLLGLSVVAGRDNRIAFTFGGIFGKENVLTNGLRLGEVTTQTDAPTRERSVVKAFAAVTFTLRLK